MSNPTPQSPAAPKKSDEFQIKIVSHSSLFYWWPIWALGFIFGLLSLASGQRMLVVPSHSTLEHKRTVEGFENKGAVDVLMLPEKHEWPNEPGKDSPAQPHLRVAKNPSYAVIFIIFLLLVIVITNVPLRGLWSVMVLGGIVALTIIFHLMEWWAPILDALFRLHVHINAAGYFLIAIVLLGIWLATFLLFDSQIYMVFTPGQLRVRQEIGGGESAYDTAGMVIQKQRNDLFRHWVLGLGSGDLIVITSGATSHHFDLPNVLFVGHKVHLIEDLLREKAVVSG